MTFGMLHVEIFDSSIMDVDPMTRLVFTYMVVLSDPYTGRVDMTLSALARRMHLDDDTVAHAIKILGSPDPESRSTEYEGRRIIPIDEARSWGWIVVNRVKYSSGKKRTRDHIRQQTLERVNRYREKKKKPRTKKSRSAPFSSTDADAAFERVWAHPGPRKSGKVAARKHFDALLSGNSEADKNQKYKGNLNQLETDLARAFENYAAEIRDNQTASRFIKHASTFIFNFQDYVERDTPTTPPRGLVV
jgi:hypothetical protein